MMTVAETSTMTATELPRTVNRSAWAWRWQCRWRWVPSSVAEIMQSEGRLLSLVKTPFLQEQVKIRPESSSSSSSPVFINTVTFECTAAAGGGDVAPTLVLLHGYAGAQGFYFRNFDALASCFRVIAIDQLGWGVSSRPDFTCKSPEEADNWFIESFEEWRMAKNLDKFILLGHSLGGYVAAKYALKYPEHIQHLILVGPAGFCEKSSKSAERLTEFGSAWQRAVLGYLWESNFTPQKIIRGLGPWGPNIIRQYASNRFLSNAIGDKLNEQEFNFLSDYIYHTVAARPSAELCLKYIYAFGAFTRKPLLASASEWKVPTTFIYGEHDWEKYQDAQEARKLMNVAVDIITIKHGGHLVFMENAEAFHAAVLHACHKMLYAPHQADTLHEDCSKV